ncbi:sulfatase [Neolewinella aurantiaca]|uniref:Sulfatase n=1 Tax=Neolewinella aurantiaca TaxID=2602767 RepID=A0A5C7F205_9BACT|nr:sulfatase [Neolewinella aurantiaca]TXF83899.1 sulfatase [Neolewinella aurantiaca]
MHKLLLLLLCLLAGLTSCTKPTRRAAETADSRPNLILIVADDHGKDALGCYGNPVVRTPNLDALAATGTRYDRAFCTTSSCSASRSVILSGLHNHRNGQFGHEHGFHHFLSYDTVRSLPVMLEEVGYRTAHVGKFHVGPESVYHFQDRFKANTRSPIEMIDATRPLMEGKEPFFLYIAFSDPHRDGKFREALPHAPDGFGNIPQGYPGIREVTYDPDDVLVPDYLPETPETRAELAQYYQSVPRLDQGVGHLAEQLKATGRYENTTIAYISDNGAAFPGAKTTLYEPGMQLPCIVKEAGQTTGKVSRQLVSWTDIVPTFLSAAGVDYGQDYFHGSDIVSRDTTGEQTVFASHTFHEITMYYPMRVARGERYKLIVNFASGLPYPFASDLYESKTWQSVLSRNLTKLGTKEIEHFIHRPRFELYDVVDDPEETNNLASDPAFAGVLEKMTGQVRNFQDEAGDPWIVKWAYE